MKMLLKIAATFLALGFAIGYASAQPILLTGNAPAGMDMTGSTVLSPQLVAAAIGNVSTSISLTQIVVAAPAIPVKLTLTSTPNPSPVGTKITYSGTVVCSNNGAGPTGTITVKGLTGSQTVSLGTGGAFTCSETPTVVTAGTLVTATYNSTNATGTVIDPNCY